MIIWLDSLFRPAAPGPLDAVLVGSYTPWLVGLSFLVAAFASLAALMIAQRLSTAAPLARAVWLAAGSASMGGGIWAMHFIGMLAFALPCGVDYSAVLTLLSLLPGMMASAVALQVIGRTDEIGRKRLALSAVLMGAGIGAMHYTGMAAMDIDAVLRYDARLVVLSVVVAVVLAFVSLRHPRPDTPGQGSRRPASGDVGGGRRDGRRRHRHGTTPPCMPRSSSPPISRRRSSPRCRRRHSRCWSSSSRCRSPPPPWPPPSPVVRSRPPRRCARRSPAAPRWSGTPRPARHGCRRSSIRWSTASSPSTSAAPSCGGARPPPASSATAPRRPSATTSPS
ncbi:hypothetical protein F1643_16515 [Azospirillum sp. INR13]|nr:hypothetical protein [Azospirillum sp. INR13]